MTTRGDHVGSGLEQIMNAAPLYERYLQISRINEVRVEGRDDSDLPEFFAPAPAPVALVRIAR